MPRTRFLAVASTNRDHWTLPPLGTTTTPTPALSWPVGMDLFVNQTLVSPATSGQARRAGPRTGERHGLLGWHGDSGGNVVAVEDAECHAGRQRPGRRLCGGAAGESAVPVEWRRANL